MNAIYGNMDPINIPQMLAYIPYMDPMGNIYIYIYIDSYIRNQAQKAWFHTCPCTTPGSEKKKKNFAAQNQVILTTIVALGLACAIHFALPSVHPDRRRRETRWADPW